MTLYLACVSLNGIQGSGKGKKTLNAMQAVGGRGVQPDLAPTDFSIPLSEAAFIRRIFQYVEGISQNITDERNSVELKKFIIYICSDVSSPGSLFVYFFTLYVNTIYFTKQHYLVCLYTGGADCCL
jgi:hypothetical protein